MEYKATLSADIIASTSLNVEQRFQMEEALKHLMSKLEETFGDDVFYGRLIKGDYIECVLQDPKLALRIALILKSYIKSLNIKYVAGEDKIRFQSFKTQAIRVAVGIGELSIFDKEKGIIDGEAIYLSGRAINDMDSKKQTFIFRSNVDEWNTEFNPIFSLLDFIFLQMSSTQSEIIYHKLLKEKEEEIKEITNKSQPTINVLARRAGWAAIDDAVSFFEQTIN